MASKLILHYKANNTDLETLNSTSHDSENSNLISFSGLASNKTAPLKNYTRSRFADHFKVKDTEVVPEEEEFLEFEDRKKEKNRTILTFKSGLITKLSSVEEAENEKATDNLFELNSSDEDSKPSRLLLKLKHRKPKLVRILKHKFSKCIYKRMKRENRPSASMLEKPLFDKRVSSTKEITEAINKYEQSPSKIKEEIEAMIIASIDYILSSQEGTNLFKLFYSLTKQKSTSKPNFIAQIDFKSHVLFGNYQNIIEIINHINETDPVDSDIVYQKFNSEETWVALISSKNGKNVVETLMANLNKGNPSSHSKLFSVIHSNFLNFSKSNYTTFVVQKYISLFRTGEAFSLVQSNFEALINNRNGIFVTISALKAYKKDKLSRLLDMIMEKVEVLSKGIYTSTMIEFVFRTFPQFCIDFANKKLTYLIGKPT